MKKQRKMTTIFPYNDVAHFFILPRNKTEEILNCVPRVWLRINSFARRTAAHSNLGSAKITDNVI